MRPSSNRVLTLRLSLLLALGALPVACGGTTQGGPDEAGGAAGSGGTGNVDGKAGDGGGKVVSKPESCSDPQLDPVTHLVTCAEGYRHRPQAVACSPVVAHVAPFPQGGASGAAPLPGPIGMPRANYEECTTDPNVCSAFQYGFCEPGNSGPVGSFCRSGCVVDDDCGPGFLCGCGYSPSPTGGVCTPSECRTDGDCESGYRCASYRGGCGGDGFACQTPNDTCTYETCTEYRGCKPVGALDGHRECQGLPVCGRPFLVEALPRVAPVTTSAAWNGTLERLPRLDHLSASERAEQAAHWTRMGQMEHASIAAFARFSLQLLALGAPPDLIEACTQALADETAHTRLCFFLASAYAREPIGPGRLDVDGSLNVTTLTDIVDLVLAEGCWGETSAALEALDLAEEASDPVIRDAYARIARDEQRHAELAFRFLRWALTREPLRVRERIELARQSLPTGTAAVCDVVLPCLDVLLESPGATAQA